MKTTITLPGTGNRRRRLVVLRHTLTRTWAVAWKIPTEHGYRSEKPIKEFGTRKEAEAFKRTAIERRCPACGTLHETRRFGGVTMLSGCSCPTEAGK